MLITMWLQNLSVLSLIVLLFLELGLKYDTLERQLALTSTNVLGVALYALMSRYLRRRGVTLPPWLWLLVALGIWFDAAGNFAHLYAGYRWWDQVAHVVGPLMVGAIIVYIFKNLREQGKIRVGRWWHDLICISTAMFFTVLYELIEYLGDLLFDTHRITNLVDTADDLWWGLVPIVLITAVLNKRFFRQTKIDD